jgi:hypothetical protein
VGVEGDEDGAGLDGLGGDGDVVDRQGSAGLPQGVLDLREDFCRLTRGGKDADGGPGEESLQPVPVQSFLRPAVETAV